MHPIVASCRTVLSEYHHRNAVTIEAYNYTTLDVPCIENEPEKNHVIRHLRVAH
jgi:hypothetical protein